MKLSITLFASITWIFLASCQSENETPSPGSNGNPAPAPEWSIPKDEVLDGGPGKDGIPALSDPNMIGAAEATYLSESNLILGYKNGDDIRAYPHAILDWHEIINDKVNGHAIAVTYCPLTGSGIGWDRVINGTETTFGVSGLLFNSNLIPYDRETDSNWSQMRLDCVNGKLKDTKITTFPLLETTWGTWKEMYPDTRVVSTETGYSRNYKIYPYGDYRTNDSYIIFPYKPVNDRLPAKERILGVIIDRAYKSYRFIGFGSLRVLNDELNQVPIVIAGSLTKNFLVAFSRQLEDGTILTFEPASTNNLTHILMDNEGNTWNVFGEAVIGPRSGQKLATVNSFISYWFAMGAFYPNIRLN